MLALPLSERLRSGRFLSSRSRFGLGQLGQKAISPGSPVKISVPVRDWRKFVIGVMGEG